MSNDKLKIKKPELKNWQKRHLANYNALVKTGTMTAADANKQLNRHKIDKSHWLK